MIYSKDLVELVKTNLTTDITNTSPNSVRGLLEKNLDTTRDAIAELVGKEFTLTETIIPADICNDRFFARLMYSVFMDEFNEFIHHG